MWAPDSVNFDRQIMIDDVLHTGSQWFENMSLVDQIQDPFAREPGYMYYRTQPKRDVVQAWTTLVRQRKQLHNF